MNDDGVAQVIAADGTVLAGPRQLRQRIDLPFGRASLQTVRLVGYRLVPDA